MSRTDRDQPPQWDMLWLFPLTANCYRRDVYGVIDTDETRFTQSRGLLEQIPIWLYNEEK